MSKIKTRDTVKDIKALDKAATAAERMKDAFVRTKDSAEHTQTPEHDSPNDYAIEKIKGTAEDAGREAAHQAGDMGGKAFHKALDVHRSCKEAKQAADGAKDTVDGVRESSRGAKDTVDSIKKSANGVKDRANDIKNATNGIKDTAKGVRGPTQSTGGATKGTRKTASGVRDTGRTVQDTSRSARTAADLPKELMKKRAWDTVVRRSGARIQQTADTAARTTDRAIKTAGTAEKTIKQAHSAEKSIKTAAKGTVKTARKSIKTAEQTAKTTIKTTQQVAKAAQKTTQATVKAAWAAAQAARAAAKATAAAAKATVKAMLTFVKAAIAATRALITAIAAGGGVAVAVILIICMVALLVCSVFGIFFSSENGASQNGMTMKTVVSQINTEFADELERIINENPHDDYDISADRAEWKEVLAVYAVKTNTDPDNPLDVITLDDEKVELLKTVFWDMNTIDYWIGTIEHTSTTTNEDGSTDTDTWYEYILHITVTGKTASEMAEQYGFNAEQKELLEELLRPEYDELWRAVLYGSLSGSTDIVEVAISQIGNVGGEPYWSWYGFDSRVEWCTCFVSWCANECGYIEAGILRRVLFRGLPDAKVRAYRGSKPSISGKTAAAAIFPIPAILSSLIGRAMEVPTMWASWNMLRTASFTPSRVIQAIAAAGGAIPSTAA